MKHSNFEKILASAAFLVAAALAFCSLMLSSYHDIAAGVLMAIAQFLLLAASILHIDYKLNIYGASKFKRNPKQQPTEYSNF